jgi:hypothetical protein
MCDAIVGSAAQAMSLIREIQIRDVPDNLFPYSNTGLGASSFKFRNQIPESRFQNLDAS